MPARKTTIKQTFVLGQPLFRPSARKRAARWEAVISEAEPRDQQREKHFTRAFTPPGETEGKDDHAFRRLNRAKLVAGLADDPPAAWHRVALICGAGLGKTTNLQWLEAGINRHAQHHGRQLAVFVELENLTDSAEDLLKLVLKKMLNKRDDHGLFAAKLKLDLIRRRRQGRITLLLDSLDQAGAGPDDATVPALRSLLESVWQPCPIWVSGRPSAFKQNQRLFCDEQCWTYVRVGQLDEPETRFLLEATRGMACQEEQRMSRKRPTRHLYDDLSPAAQRLAQVPRIGRLIGRLSRAATEKLSWTATAAEVFWLLYTYDTSGDDTDCGLLADGLKVKDARRLAWWSPGEPVLSESFRRYQVRRAAGLLGAIAFEMLTTGDRPVYAIEHDYEQFREKVLGQFLRAGAHRDQFGKPEADNTYLGADWDYLLVYLGRDWDCLLRMDSHGLKNFIFTTAASDQRLRWTDITTMAFFAAYWACRWATPDERKLLEKRVFDPLNDTTAAYYEFWRFAVEMPEEAIDHGRWEALFAPLYNGALRDEKGQPIRSTEFIYRAWDRMNATKTGKQIVGQFLTQFDAFRDTTTAQQMLAGLLPIKGGAFKMGSPKGDKDSDPDEHLHDVVLRDFRIHRYCVTNLEYELFDPRHKDHRWEEKPHPLVKNRGPSGDDRCPVVNVSWYDAWCFAMWTGNHLPTEAQWEYSCRGGLPNQIFACGNSLSSNDANFDGRHPYGDAKPGPYKGCTTPVGSYPENGFKLCDMPGNVWEWCLDWYEEKFGDPEKGTQHDPENKLAASRGGLRGGSWYDLGGRCRSAYRDRRAPDYRSRYYGFRLAAVPSLEPGQASA